MARVADPTPGTNQAMASQLSDVVVRELATFVNCDHSILQEQRL